MNRETGKRSKIASISLQEGMCTHIQLSYSSTKKQKSLFSPPNPFPPPKRNATFIGRDEITGGDWIGTYGSAGYFLVAFDGPNQHVSVLPSWVINITNPIGQAQNGPWYDPIPDHDRRALLDPRNTSAPRKIGQFSAPPPPADGWAPSLPFDMTVTDDAPEGFTYQFAFYFVDYDTRGRRQSVQLMDQLSKSDISPTQMVRDFVNGVWLVCQFLRAIPLSNARPTSICQNGCTNCFKIGKEAVAFNRCTNLFRSWCDQEFDLCFKTVRFCLASN
jgi:hypothetical protein